MSASLAAGDAPRPAADPRDFEVIARIAREEAGLVLHPEKAPMVLARLGKRMRALGLATLSDYCGVLTGPDAARERQELVWVLTTNVTSFFRERHHLDHMVQSLVPDWRRRLEAGGRVRIWSAGCSSGEEPYSIAMSLFDALGDPAGRDLKILATDIDPNVLALARAGRYPAAALDRLPAGWRDRFFDLAPDAADRFDLRDTVRRLVTLRPLNLLAPWPMRGRFDAIFCRNVVIYFDHETQAALWPRFAAACAPEGHLYLGHSERIEDPAAAGFRTVGTTTYRRIGREADRAARETEAGG